MSSARTARRGWRRSRCPRRLPSPLRLPSRNRASSCGASFNRHVSSAPQYDQSDPASPNQLTIEQLAAQSGMSVRNIRSHQARGLLAPPEVRVRVGYYGPQHVAQLKLIRELQEEGFNLNGIKRLLDDTQGTAERLARFRRAVMAPLAEAPEIVPLGELAERFRLERTAARDVLARAHRLGVLVPVGGDRYEVPAPSLLAAAEEVVRRGIPLQAATAVIEELGRHSDEVARGFVQLFLQEVWAPFLEADMSES